MKNKKGYLRMLEAIIAVIIIFGAVLTMLPRKQVQLAEMPAEVDSTLKSVLEEAQTNEQFRTCLLLNNDASIQDPKISNNLFKSNKECLKDSLNDALPIFTQWAYGFSICPLIGDCVDYPGEGRNLAKNIYTKSTVISVPDAVTKPFRVKTTTPNSICCNPSVSANVQNGCELNDKGKVKDSCVTGKTITIYIWEKL